MNEECILAIDLGTTNCKTLLLDRSCRVVKKAVLEYGVSVPRPGWSEQNPEDWWAAVRAAIKMLVQGVDPKSIRAVGLSGQMHGLVLLDRGGLPLRPAPLWNDQRSLEECQEIYDRVGGPENLLKLTNNAMIPGYTGGKILWVKKHEPEIFARAAHVLLPKDYIRYRLTGQYATDVSDASGTGLFDVRNRSWSVELIEMLGFPKEWFPRAFESPETTGEITAEVAAHLGLEPGTPVTAGGGDAVIQPIGSGATNQDKALIVVGTSGNVTVSIPSFAENPQGRLQCFCSVVPGRWVELGVTLSAGGSLKWFRDTLGGLERELARDLQVSPYQLLGEMAAKSPPGSGGLIFLPYLQGERAPHVDVNASGAVIGLRTGTHKADIVRCVMEGVAYSLRDVLELILKTGANPQVVHLSGGGSASPLWRQIFADVLDRQVVTLDYSEDAGAVGAGIIAGTGMGFWPSADEAVEQIRVSTVTDPIAENVPVYERQFGLYQELYPRLKPVYDQMAGGGKA